MELLQPAFIAHMHAAFRGRAPYINKKAENRGTPYKREGREYLANIFFPYFDALYETLRKQILRTNMHLL